jgi:hypothetical protein
MAQLFKLSFENGHLGQMGTFAPAELSRISVLVMEACLSEEDFGVYNLKSVDLSNNECRSTSLTIKRNGLANTTKRKREKKAKLMPGQQSAGKLKKKSKIVFGRPEISESEPEEDDSEYDE